MSFLAGILTVVLIANCVVLAFLVLIQLPKKDAGAGVAFGGGAADALFGAGSGNTLTKITKWATICFFVLALFLDFAENRLHRNNASEFEKAVQQVKLPMAPPVVPAGTPVPTATQTPVPASTNQPVMPLLSQPISAPAATNNPTAAPPQSK
jgi:protein translocase SecG subunit